MLMLEDVINLGLVKKIMTVKKTTLASIRNQSMNVETEGNWNWKSKQIIIKSCNISELNEVIYAQAKLVCDRIGISQEKLKKNTKPGGEIRLEG